MLPHRRRVRRKPGTDTKFPAQFAGNWLSAPGFARVYARTPIILFVLWILTRHGRPFHAESLGHLALLPPQREVGPGHPFGPARVSDIAKIDPLRLPPPARHNSRPGFGGLDRKSTRLNSSHLGISY